MQFVNFWCTTVQLTVTLFKAYIWKSLLQYSFSYIVVVLLFYWNMQQSLCEISKLLHCPLCCSLWNYFGKKIIKDHWFIIYAMIHVFNWKMCLLDHSKIIHPLFSPSLIWQLDLNNTLKQMALAAKKKLCKGETETLEILTAATVLSFWKIVPLLILSTPLIRKERYTVFTRG